MLRDLFKRLGYDGIDDAVEFLMCGLAVVPALLMLCGFMLGGALAMVGLLVLTMAVGVHATPPAPNEKPSAKPDKPPGA